MSNAKFDSSEIEKEPEEIKSSRENNVLGTANYMAPELLEGNEATAAVDYWALGVILYEIYVGHTPFYAESVEIIFDNIKHIRIDYEVLEKSSEITSQSLSLIRCLLDPNPETRLSSFTKFSQHEFFQCS